MECEACCPHCFQGVSLWVDAGGGERQDYVEDCSVCCRPWRVRVWFDEAGVAQIDLARLDD